jgi:5'-nucleotidase
VIEQLLEHRGDQPQLYNLNIPTIALENGGHLRVVPMGLERYGEQYEKRIDPRGRSYYWATNLPSPQLGVEETDLTSLEKGEVTLTALHYDMTHREMLEAMRSWNVQVPTVTE